MSALRLTIALALIVGCSEKSSAPTKKPADDYTPSGVKPAKAREPSPASVKKQPAGTPAPAIEITDNTGQPWSLANALTKTKRVVLVFYRGDW